MTGPGPTLAERIIAGHLTGGADPDTVRPGALVTVDVDRVYVQDGNSPTIARLWSQHGLGDVFDAGRIAFVFDHSVIVPDRLMADRVREATDFARSLGVQVYARGAGISHVVALEQGWFEPGSLVLGSDSHTCTGGALQSLALGMGASDIAGAMATGRTWLKVPETVWLDVRGTPHPAVRAKDVVLSVLRTYGQRPFLYRSVEWTGGWAGSLSLDSAASVASMAVEMGAKAAFLPDGPGRPAGLRDTTPAEGGEVLTLDVSGMMPQVAVPHSPSTAVDVDELAGRGVDYVFVGSCTNSRIEDIAEVAGAMAGRTVHPDVHALLTPGSREILLEATALGYVETLTRAGVVVTPAGCGACVGTQGTVPATGETVLSTMNRNFRGRMGNPDADIYLSSPLVAAHAAVLGRFPHSEELVGS